jgi:hypothetical protein
VHRETGWKHDREIGNLGGSVKLEYMAKCRYDINSTFSAAIAIAINRTCKLVEILHQLHPRECGHGCGGRLAMRA